MGSLFLIVFGVEIAYSVLWVNDEEWTESEPLEGHSVTYNSTGHIIPIVSHLKVEIEINTNIIFFLNCKQSEMNEFRDNSIEPTFENIANEANINRVFQRRALTFMAFINVG